MSISEFLSNSAPPRLALLSSDRCRGMIESAKKAGYSIWEFDGLKMKTDGALFDHFAQRMQFPDYFGRNWDAMDECLRDLAWAPASAHMLVIHDADSIIFSSPRLFTSLFNCLRFVSNHWHSWNNRRIPFKVLFVIAIGKLE